MDLRQIDALVAKQVMEERVIDIPFIPNTVYPKTALFTDEAASEWRKVYPHSYPIKTIPRYSSEIAAAWQVVEKMRRSGWDYFSLVQGHEGAWDCMFMQWSGPDDDEVSQEIADTAPLAICLAALRAVGVDVPGDRAVLEQYREA